MFSRPNMVQLKRSNSLGALQKEEEGNTSQSQASVPKASQFSNFHISFYCSLSWAQRTLPRAKRRRRCRSPPLLCPIRHTFCNVFQTCLRTDASPSPQKPHCFTGRSISIASLFLRRPKGAAQGAHTQRMNAGTDCGHFFLNDRKSKQGARRLLTKWARVYAEQRSAALLCSSKGRVVGGEEKSLGALKMTWGMCRIPPAFFILWLSQPLPLAHLICICSQER